MDALLTDYYQLTMLQAYLEEGLHGEAVFELFVRRLPGQRNYLVLAGIEQAVAYLESLQVSETELAWLERQGRFSPRTLDQLANMRFEGDVDAMPEGTVFFANEPVLQVTAPLPQAQFVESRLLNLVHFQTLVASKAARLVHAAQGRPLFDFGLRRAHGSEAALHAARAAYLAGLSGTATVSAAMRFGIPAFGTMAHAYVQAHDTEQQAFDAFLRSWPDGTTLLVDTYDTERAVARLAEAAPGLATRGLRPGAIRLDSGDLLDHARRCRSLLDGAGLGNVRIFASGDLDEHRIAALLAQGAPIDGFGAGTALVTSSDAPALDMVYKLQAFNGLPRFKHAEGKRTWPGVKQVYRYTDAEGQFAHDVVCLRDEPLCGVPLLRPLMRHGRRVTAAPTLQKLRSDHQAQKEGLPSLYEARTPVPGYRVDISPRIQSLRDALLSQLG